MRRLSFYPQDSFIAQAPTDPKDFRRDVDRGARHVTHGRPVDMSVGCPPEQHHRIKPVTHSGEAMTADDYRALGLPVPTPTEVTEEALQSFDRSEVRQLPVAGGGGIMSAAELALFYQALINEGRAHDGAQLCSSEILRFATAPRNQFLADSLPLANTHHPNHPSLCKPPTR